MRKVLDLKSVSLGSCQLEGQLLRAKPFQKLECVFGETQLVQDPKTAEAYKIDRLIPFNPVDKRTTAYLTDSEGQKLVTTKGAPQVPILLYC